MRLELPTRLAASSALIAAVALSGCFGASDLTQGTQTEPKPELPVTDDPTVTPTPEECANAAIDPGRVTIHRLNRAEYNNTVRDLLGDTTQPAKDFPADDHGYGFDNNADVLSLAPLLMEKYEAAAEKLVEDAWTRDFTPGQTTRIEAESATKSTGAASGNAWNIYSNGTVSQAVSFVTSGSYTLSARAWGQQAGGAAPIMEFRIDNQVVATFTVNATSGAPQVYTKDVNVTAGSHTFAVAFTNDFYDAASGADRNLLVDWFEAKTPGSWAGANAKLRICDPAVDGESACGIMILQTFARRAWRRTVSPGELDRLMGFLTLAKSHGDGFDVGMKLALQAVLLSPHFLYRVELDPDPASLQPHKLNDFELAARLSYFLWSSTPDGELLTLAEQNLLSDPVILEQQVQRLLADERASALVENFAGQWLETRAVDSVEPNSQLYGEFSPELRADMKAETQLFFREFLEQGRPVRDLLDADFTYLNDRLAAHYGLPAVGSQALTRVTLPAGGVRGGLLRQASFLTITSHPDRTSPVKRGQWVLKHLLCNEPPPPPPNVENFVEGSTATGTLRERMEEHRANPTCAGCHSMMDPIGFGFENYDAVGKYRELDGAYPIDATGELPGGATFDGPAELAQIIKADPRLSACVAKNLMVYALGRGDSPADHCAVQKLAESFDARGGRFTDLIHVIAQSEPFTMRRGEAAGGNP